MLIAFSNSYTKKMIKEMNEDSALYKFIIGMIEFNIYLYKN